MQPESVLNTVSLRGDIRLFVIRRYALLASSAFVCNKGCEQLVQLNEEYQIKKCEETEVKPGTERLTTENKCHVSE